MKRFKFQISNLKSSAPAVRRPLLLIAYCLLSTVYCLLPPTSTHAAAWERQKTGTFAWLHAVFFVDERRGWAAGGKGALLSTADGGTTWELSKPPTEDAVRDVFFHDAATGWLLCERSMFKPMEKDESVSYLLKTADGGRTWSRVEVTRGADVDLKLAGLRFADREHGWVFGELGALFATEDGGATWSRRRVPTRHLLLGASFHDARTGWLSGGGLTVLKTYGRRRDVARGDGLPPCVGRRRAAATVRAEGARAGQDPRREAAERRFSRRLNAVCFVDPERRVGGRRRAASSSRRPTAGARGGRRRRASATTSST